jgi:hypothetical protein
VEQLTTDHLALSIPPIGRARLLWPEIEFELRSDRIKRPCSPKKKVAPFSVLDLSHPFL